MKKTLSLFLANLLFLITSTNTLPDLKIPCQLARSEYNIYLIDLRPYIMNFFNSNMIVEQERKNFNQGIFNRKLDKELSLFRLGLMNKKNKGPIFRIGTINLYKMLSNISYADRVLSSFEHIDLQNQNKINYLKKIHIPTEKKINNHNCISYVDGFDAPFIANHKRANIFDMFSTEVDEYILDYGIVETIMHIDNTKPYLQKEEQLQISLFGAIEGSYIDDQENFSYLGFFQYTFNDQGICYHRAFKPLTQYNLERISNSKTQAILRLAVLNFINEKIEYLYSKKAINFSRITQLEKYKQEVLKVSKKSNDHKINYMFSFPDPNNSEKLSQIFKAINIYGQ